MPQQVMYEVEAVLSERGSGASHEYQSLLDVLVRINPDLHVSCYFSLMRMDGIHRY